MTNQLKSNDSFEVNGLCYQLAADKKSVVLLTPHDEIEEGIEIPNKITYIGKSDDVVSIFEECFGDVLVEGGCVYEHSEDNEDLLKLFDTVQTFEDELIIPSHVADLENIYDVDIIEENVFMEQPIKSLVLSEGINGIVSQAFCNCKNLQEVTLPNSLYVIDILVFAGCTSLMKIKYQGTKEEWSNVEKGEDWNLDVPAEFVTCLDGEVLLNEN